MTSAIEGDQFPHPDSPAGRADAVAEEERRNAEANARAQAEFEQAHAEIIADNRRRAHQKIKALRADLRLLDRNVKRLGQSDLYDVEYVEGNGGGEVLYVHARAQIDVALAALDALIPAEDA